ncbi:DinB family protein [Pedobacter xixiisoli]|uniref:DinB superfamily protein n=1 Tax=Pedobacter xixiisoli TaxID=1476464 RepID=A0A285ZZQ0_9SPHI|nr:DinB family protein [Pedobacter xixiisoli]SOD15108.1 DinB superfamily protein [Pedobacter xixiisoli]
MVTAAIERLAYLVDIVPDLLAKFSEEELSMRPLPNKWSKKEVIGHLIDSATNNHQRFIRGQFELEPSIAYQQDQWNEFNHYGEIAGGHVIAFWKIYHQHLLEVIKRIPSENLSKQVSVGDNLHSLAFLVVDYVAHLEHHLKQIVAYE